VRVNQWRMARALRVFRQYIDDCAPRCDPAYDQAYYDALVATQTSPTPLKRRLRFYSLVQLLREALPLEGVVAECGCYRGLSSYLLCTTLKSANAGFDGRGYRIFDSFQGLSARQPEDTIEDTAPDADILKRLGTGHFAVSVKEVKAGLAAFPRIEFFPGWIPDAFPDEPGARYRFVHLDVDLYQPTRDSLDYFYPRLAPGGILVCDDYNWPGARKAIEDFCARMRIALETTPHMQAVLRKNA
jgi:O-methyltransferase